MIVFVVNCGSSSIKYQLFDMTDESVLARGLLERVGQSGSVLHHRSDETTHEIEVDAPNHTVGLKIILDTLVDPKIGVLKNIEEIEGVGHRVVHGGEQIRESTLIDDNVIKVIKDNASLAPLHNPPNLAGIEAAMSALSNVPQVAVFDTAFLATLPPRAYRYAVPRQWYEKYRVRRYGFHGTSHRYVTLRAAEILGKSVEEVNLITAHLGNGCSMTAVAGGKAIDHSMGLTPLEGLVMGTRSGDIDPAVIFYMARTAGMSLDEIDTTLNKKSGLLGLSGVSNDMRDCIEAAEKGNTDAALAMEVFSYRVAKYIGAYFAILPGCDAIIMTGGIGENSLPIRLRICQLLSNIGVIPDEKRNEEAIRKVGLITADDSKIPVWIIPTNEELMIARDTRDVVEQMAVK